MTHTEIVAEAIKALNKNKHTNIEYDRLENDNDGGVNVYIKYPNAPGRPYGFVDKGFKAEHISFEDLEGMAGFKVSDTLRVTNPEAVMILRIAGYFYKTGKDNHLF